MDFTCSKCKREGKVCPTEHRDPTVSFTVCEDSTFNMDKFLEQV